MGYMTIGRLDKEFNEFRKPLDKDSRIMKDAGFRVEAYKRLLTSYSEKIAETIYTNLPVEAKIPSVRFLLMTFPPLYLFEMNEANAAPGKVLEAVTSYDPGAAGMMFEVLKTPIEDIDMMEFEGEEADAEKEEALLSQK